MTKLEKSLTLKLKGYKQEIKDIKEEFEQEGKEHKKEIKKCSQKIKALEQANIILSKDNKKIRKKNKKIKKQNKRYLEKIASLKKNSSTSSKKGSSEIVKPKKGKKGKKGKKNKKGGQPGHKGHFRKPFEPKEIDETIDYILDACPECNGALELQADGGQKLQQIELIAKPTKITEYVSYKYWCENCQKYHTSNIPLAIKKTGLCGPNLMAFIAYMKCGLHASFNSIRIFLSDVMNISFERSYIYKIIRKTSKVLLVPYEELLEHIPLEARLNIDETGHKNNGELFWTWCFRAEMYVLFKIKKSRGSQVLIEMLGEEFNGTIGCDYFSAYRKYMKDFNITIQFCLAHLIRDIKFLTTLPNKKEKEYGKKLLEKMRELFKLINDNDEIPNENFDAELKRIKEEFLDIGIKQAPIEKTKKGKEVKSKSRNLYIRFLKHGKNFFQFITTPGMEPTNNIAEQAIRFIVIDRHITQGTRSVDGMQNNEIIWTVMGSCAIQKRSAYKFIQDSINSSFNPALKRPTLVPIQNSS